MGSEEGTDLPQTQKSGQKVARVRDPIKEGIEDIIPGFHKPEFVKKHEQSPEKWMDKNFGGPSFRTRLPIFLQGRLNEIRYRTSQMTDDERAFRKQFMRDQKLHPSEPRYVPPLYRFTTNSFARSWNWLWDRIIHKKLESILGNVGRYYTRYYAPKIFVLYCFILFTDYHFRFKNDTWDNSGFGFRVMYRRPVYLLGDKGYEEPFKADLYDDRGFGSRSVYLDLDKMYTK